VVGDNKEISAGTGGAVAKMKEKRLAYEVTEGFLKRSVYIE
jgi:hypothetical protein